VLHCFVLLTPPSALFCIRPLRYFGFAAKWAKTSRNVSINPASAHFHTITPS
jgi:hypothetical protein